jgi:hypothetical protein
MEETPPGADEREEEQTGDGQTDKDQTEEGVLGEILPEEEVEEPSSGQTPRPRRRQRSRMIGCLLALLGALAGGGVAWWVSYDADEREAETVSNLVAPNQYMNTNRVTFSPTPERPDETPEIISAETSVIYCFYELGGVPVDAPLAATWSHDGEFLGDLPLSDHRPAEDVEYARGRFTLHPPNDEDTEGAAETIPSFPPGIYEVELTSPEYADITAAGSFVALPRAAQILQGGGDPDGPPLIRSLQTTVGVTENGEPLDQRSVFPQDIERITAVFSYSGIPAGSVLTVRWHIGDRELTDAGSDMAINAAEGWAEAWLEPGAGETLPAGDYRVTVHLGDEDKPLASMGFSIAPSE